MTEHPGEAAPAERNPPAAPRPATGPGGAQSGGGGGQSGDQVRPEADAGLEELPPNLTQAILEATKQVASLLKGAGHPFALAGSVAVYAHGGPGNLQHDADFCVLPEDADAVAATLRDAGLEVYTPPEDWLLKARCMGQDIDLIFELARQPVTRELLGRAEELPVESVRMPVLPVTDLLASLLNAFTEHHCDFGAVLPIARALREKVDWPRVRRECGAAPMPDAFLYLLERLQVISPQDEDRGGLP
ncbi:nucleotidyltransferase family protein [Streptomyces verrucosisporus]|uniref:nucleotidyltransferase family protein n=1 Tax=Streptomyces verrucosisporus TaxID=1695161 RepID=UPI0019D29AB9|nr:nucleotidyltransferase family protein [Streptomyces verrucosisporus]MBN3929502.1 nucleotidyltransferase family protein [Streptomyces verrucosisporus]